jgi:hypothetical protein
VRAGDKRRQSALFFNGLLGLSLLAKGFQLRPHEFHLNSEGISLA